MKSPNEQYLIVQELNKINSFVADAGFNIVGYEADGEYRIAISSTIGMIPEVYIKRIVALSELYGFSWFLSDSCLAVDDGNLIIIIY